MLMFMWLSMSNSSFYKPFYNCLYVVVDVDCEVLPWLSWSPCSVTCDNGTRSRRREISVDPVADGARCPSLREEERCQPRLCGMLVALLVLSLVVASSSKKYYILNLWLVFWSGYPMLPFVALVQQKLICVCVCVCVCVQMWTVRFFRGYHGHHVQ